jgi:prevent-host-death family protein
MIDVNVTDLRQNLPSYLKKVQRGEHIRVTSRGKVIAELAPPRPSRTTGDAARARLKGSVVRYDRPFEPALPPEEWEANR